MFKFLLFSLIAIVALIVGGIIAIGFYLSPQDELQKADAIVAISGGETDQRTKEAVELYYQELAPVLLFSGAARDQGVSNADIMKQSAVASGVPEDKIIIEDQAQNTFDNAKFVRDLLHQNNIDSIILVTSPYHQRRAYSTFRRILGDNFSIINHSSTDSAWRKNGWWRDDWARALTWSELQKNIILPLAFGVVKT